MSDTRSLTAGLKPCTPFVAAWFALLVAAPAAAQIPQPIVAPAPASPEFLSRYDFHLTAYALSGPDDPAERFSWDTHFGGSLDVVDYVVGRASVVTDYEVILGQEFRPFDPNQGSYTLEGSASARAGDLEIVAFFRHVSRHLSDRPKRFSIAWNTVGGGLIRRVTVAGFTIDGHLDVGKAVQHSFVDYTWIGNLDVLVRRPLTPGVGLFVHGSGRVVGVNSAISDRGAQAGGVAEAGLRVSGRGGVLELFAGVERRVDAYPLDGTSQYWGLAGFRLLSR